MRHFFIACFVLLLGGCTMCESSKDKPTKEEAKPTPATPEAPAGTGEPAKNAPGAKSAPETPPPATGGTAAPTPAPEVEAAPTTGKQPEAPPAEPGNEAGDSKDKAAPEAAAEPSLDQDQGGGVPSGADEPESVGGTIKMKPEETNREIRDKGDPERRPKKGEGLPQQSH